MARNTIESLQVALDKRTCQVLWKDGHISRFNAKWLRFNCRCEKCKASRPGMYIIDVASFPDDLSLKEATSNENGSEIQSSFNGDVPSSHVARHPADWLRAKCYCDPCLDDKIRHRDVITRSIADSRRERKVRQVEYGELHSDGGLFRMLENLLESGFCLIKNVPAEDEMVLKVARMVGHVDRSSYGEKFEVFSRATFDNAAYTDLKLPFHQDQVCYEVARMVGHVDRSSYGEKFEVFSRATFDNAAYTDLKLPFHQDQVCYEVGPGIQFLHAIAFDDCVIGGESMLVDLFEVVEIVRSESEDNFRALCEVPITHDTIYLQMGRYYEHQKPTVNLDYFGKVVGVNWNPGLLGVPQVREQDVERFYRAHSAMLKVIRRENIQFRFKLERGDLIAMNNRRMAHSREAYKANGGNRHLQGAYLKLDDWRSKYMTLAAKLGKDVVPPKMGTNSSF